MNTSHTHRFSQNGKRMRASEIRELLKLTNRPEVISFAGGLPNPEIFPIEQLRTVIQHVMAEHPRDALQYCATEGHNKLRDAIARGMGRVHDTAQSIHNIMITHGSQQALNLLGHILLDPGDVVVMGAPAYLGAVQAFEAFRASIESVPLDEDGIRVDLLEQKLDSLAKDRRPPKFIYLVPTFQNPSGVTLPLERRRRIYQLACEHDVLLIEDDPYGFLRYEGEKVPLIKSLDEQERVLYLSSFSKILAPGFRIAWMAAPEAIVNKACLAKQAQDLCSNSFAQYCIFEAMYHDFLFPHIEEIIKFYRRKRDTMLAAMERHFPERARWNRPQGGLFLWVELPPFVDTRDMFAKAIANDVAYVVGHAFFPNGGGQNCMRLNFSHASDEMIEEGIERLARVIREEIEEKEKKLEDELIGGF
ncbi:MAG: PLP-dependent aminotransferase family protein [Candidatus Brocadiia bacterium]